MVITTRPNRNLFILESSSAIFQIANFLPLTLHTIEVGKTTSIPHFLSVFPHRSPIFVGFKA